MDISVNAVFVESASMIERSLIGKIRERQWDHGKFPAVYMDDVEDIIRQHEADNMPYAHITGKVSEELKRCEISVINEDLFDACMVCMGKPDDDLGQYKMDKRLIRQFLKSYLKHHTTRKPVSGNKIMGDVSADDDCNAGLVSGSSPVQKSISSKECAIAASHWFNGKNCGAPMWPHLSNENKLEYLYQARAVLDVAGVKYVD